MLPENFRDGENIQDILIILSHIFPPEVGPAGSVVVGPDARLHHTGDNGRAGGRTYTRWCVKPVKADSLLG